MLEAMDIAVGVLLAAAGLVLVGLIAALVAQRRAVPTAVEPPAEPVDDLPYFLEFPPGSVPAAPRASDSVVALAPAPRPTAPAPAPPPRRSIPVAALAVLTGLLVVLLVAAAVVAAIAGPDRRRDEQRQDSAAAEAPSAAEAQLRFGGILFEERAVGVTVTYPELTLDARAGGQVVSLEFPTWNCLATEAPEDPAEAGCVPSRTEYAELDSPDLSVAAKDDGLRIEGDFATSTRPTGSGPEPTGRSYPLVVTVEPDGSGVLELGDRRTEVVEGEFRIHD